MDLSKFNPKVAANRSATCSLKYAGTNELIRDEDGKTLDIQVLGIGSDPWSEAELEIERENAAEGIADTDKTQEQKERELARKIVAITTGWSSNIGLGNSKALKFTPENALKLYTDQQWIALQVLNDATDRKKRFFLDQPPSSNSTSGTGHG